MGTDPEIASRAPAGSPNVLLLTIAEVADLYLRTTPKAIRRLIERGCLPGVVHVGCRVLVRRDRLLQFIAENSVPSPEESRR